MNERIRELLKQASIYDGRESLYWCSEDNLNKFAELIVRECVDIADETALGETTYGWMVANRIKQHFGVDGMSTEDKKTLIKELLGVKNES